MICNIEPIYVFYKYGLKRLLRIFPQFSPLLVFSSYWLQEKKSAKMLKQHLHRVSDTGIEPEPAVQHADALLSEPHCALWSLRF